MNKGPIPRRGQLLQEWSAGSVVFHTKNGNMVFLLLHYPAGHWDFPKGKIEKGEDELATVRREVAEETGIIDLSIVDGFRRVIEYHYRRGASLIHKQVSYYLAETRTEDIKLSHEHTGYEWLPLHDSYTRVSFENSRRVLREGNEFLSAARSKSRNGSL